MNFERKDRRKYYCIYTVCFLAAAALAFGYFAVCKKSFIWKYDGLYQHYNSLVYYGKYLRSIIKTLLTEHRLSLPMWDMSIGYGSDILTTFNYYVMGDPLTLLSVFVPANKTEYLYNFLIVFRLYLAGITFSIFCRYHKNGFVATLFGAIAYSFCGFAVYATLRHAFFANPMIYLPLFVLGVDRIFDRKKPALFICMTVLSAVSNFYFFYMLCVMVLIYTIFRYIHKFGRIELKTLFSWIGRFLLYVLIGTGMSMITLLPSLMSVLTTNRMSSGHYVPLLYDLSFYLRLPGEMFNTDYIVSTDRYWTILGFVPLVLLALLFLFTQRKKYRDLKIGCIVMLLLMLLPFAGHVINGFSYACNRWGFGYAMLFCYILVKMYPEFLQLKKKQQILLGIFAVCYTLICMCIKDSRSLHVMIALLVMMLLWTVLILHSYKVISQNTVHILMAVSLFFSIGLNAYFLCSPSQTDYTDSFRDSGSGIRLLTSKAQNDIITDIDDDSLFRYDQYGMAARENTAMQKGLYGTDYYFSVNNSYISQAFDDLREKSVMEWMYDCLDGRTIMDRLAAVKYFIVRKGHEADLPYSYDTKVAENDNYVVYETENSLPFAYTYDSFISTETYNALTATEKQQAILQGVVLDDSTLTETKLNFNDQRCDLTMVPDEHISISGNTYTVTENNAVLTIRFEGAANSETYLLLDNVSYEGKATNFKFWASTDTVKKDIDVYTIRNNFYSGKDDFLCNMGYTDEGCRQITLCFPYKGTYTIEDLYVVCQPMDNIEKQVQKLKEVTMDNLAFSTNTISGTITSDKERCLVFSVAYSTGWRAWVDGQEAELSPANTMYMGLQISEGTHDIVLSYETPWLKAGCILSLLSLIVFIAMTIYNRRNNHITK